MVKTEEDIFCDALEIPVSSRAEFLGKACGGDAELRASVERLLRLHDTDDEFLVTPVIGLNEIELEEQSGDRIDCYLLEKRIGEGGFGIVWQADQLEPIKRKVALKIFKLGMDADRIVSRFEDERQTLALMNHPNIATVLDAGTTKGGRSYFAMELVNGLAIDKYSRDKSLSIEERLNVFVDVCRALQHAHQKGIVHLDLKPSNILVAEQDGKPFVKVIDFGIAKAVHNLGAEYEILNGETIANVAETCQLVGTPEYMSPEQMNSPKDVDTRSDIYSLGAVLYKLLAGTSPLQLSEIETPLDSNELVRFVTEKTPVAPSLRLANSNDKEKVRGDLDWIALKALEKNPANRYQSPNEMARDVEKHLSCQIVSATPWTMSYAVSKFVRRNRLLVTASALVVLTTIGGLIAMTFGLVQAERQRKNAVSHWQQAEKERAEAERLRTVAVQEAEESRLVANLLEQLVEGANPERGLPAEFSVREQLDNFATSFGDQLKNHPEVEARLMHTVGRAYSNLRVLEKAGPSLRRALELRLEVFPARHHLVLESRLELARFLVYDANPNEAREHIGLVLEELDSSEPSVTLAKALHVLSEVNSNTGESVDAFRTAEQAWKAACEAGGEEDFMALDYQSRAGFYAIRGHSLERAEELTSAALTGLQAHWPKRTFEINRAKGRLATVLSNQRRFAEALPLINQVIEENETQLGDASHYHVTAMLSKVSILRHLDRRDEAEELLWQAAATADRATNERSRAQAFAYRRLAEWVQRDGRTSEAEALWEKTIEARKRMDGETGRVGLEMTIRGYLLRVLGRNEEASHCFAESIRILHGFRAKQPRFYLEALYHQADHQLEIGLNEEAIGPLSESIAMANEIEKPAVYTHVAYIGTLLETDQTKLAAEEIEKWEALAVEHSDGVLAIIVQVAKALTLKSAEKVSPAIEQLAEAQEKLRRVETTIGTRRLMLEIGELIGEWRLQLKEFESAEAILLQTANKKLRTSTRIDNRRAKLLLLELYDARGQKEKAAKLAERIKAG